MIYIFLAIKYYIYNFKKILDLMKSKFLTFIYFDPKLSTNHI
jgi:hypothetical protein